RTGLHRAPARRLSVEEGHEPAGRRRTRRPARRLLAEPPAPLGAVERVELGARRLEPLALAPLGRPARPEHRLQVVPRHLVRGDVRDHCPTRPSTRSRSRSACPQCRAYSTTCERIPSRTCRSPPSGPRSETPAF